MNSVPKKTPWPMTHTPEELQMLSLTNQQFVFASDADRESTVRCMKSTFSLNEFGTKRIDCLLEHKMDRELIGHLIAMLTCNLAALQQEVLRVTKRAAQMKEEKEEAERVVLQLREESNLHREKNVEMSELMRMCGLTEALRKCETLKAASTLVRDDERGFEKLAAAVECFGASSVDQQAGKKRGVGCLEYWDDEMDKLDEQNEQNEQGDQEEQDASTDVVQSPHTCPSPVCDTYSASYSPASHFRSSITPPSLALQQARLSRLLEEHVENC